MTVYFIPELNAFIPELDVPNNAEEVVLTSPAAIRGGTFGALNSDCDLILIDCAVQIVAARNLWLINSIWEEAIATGSVWAQPRRSLGGNLVYESVKAQGRIDYVYPIEARNVTLKGLDLDAPFACPPSWDAVTFQDSRMMGGITFPGSHNLASKRVRLVGDTFFPSRFRGIPQEVVVRDDRKT